MKTINLIIHYYQNVMKERIHEHLNIEKVNISFISYKKYAIKQRNK